MTMSGAGLLSDRNHKDEKRLEGRFSLLTAIITSVAVTLLVLVTAGVGVVAYVVITYMITVRDEHAQRLAEHDQKFSEWEKMDLKKISTQSFEHETQIGRLQRLQENTNSLLCNEFRPSLRVQLKELDRFDADLAQLQEAHPGVGPVQWSVVDRDVYESIEERRQMARAAYNRSAAAYNALLATSGTMSARDFEKFEPVPLGRYPVRLYPRAIGALSQQ